MMTKKFSDETDVLKPSRRKLLNVTAAGVIAGLASPILASHSTAAEKKILIAYFSRTGNTRDAANRIHQSVGGDIVEVKTVHSYPEDYRATTDLAKQEQETNARPPITTEVANMESYGTVFIVIRTGGVRCRWHVLPSWKNTALPIRY